MPPRYSPSDVAADATEASCYPSQFENTRVWDELPTRVINVGGPSAVTDGFPTPDTFAENIAFEGVRRPSTAAA